MKLITSAVMDAIVIINDSGKIQLWNKAAEKLFGFSEEEILNRDIMTSIIPASYRDKFKIGFALFKRTGQKVFINQIIEGEGNKKDGTIIPIEFSVSEFILKEKWYALAIFRDKTQKNFEEQKLKVSEEKLKQAYENANFYKDIFAHDISNIINNIGAMNEFCFLYLKDNNQEFEKLNEIFNSIRDQIVRSRILISNIRKLSEMEENEVVINIIDIDSVLESAIKFLIKGFTINKFKITLEKKVEKSTVLANELLLDVFENILINAIKYNDNPIAHIIVKISRFIEEDINYVKIEFIDDGIGISEENKSNIFLKGDKKNKGGKGMGLGLSLVKKIIDSYYGQITIENRVKGDYSKGSNFIVLIPEAE